MHNLLGLLSLNLPDCLDDSSAIGHTLMPVPYCAGAIKHDGSGQRRNSVGAGDFAAELAEEIQANDSRLSGQILFDPIHDGLCHEAAPSGVGEEIHDHRLAATDDFVELLPGIEASRFRPQQKKPNSKQRHDGNQRDKVHESSPCHFTTTGIF
jgi:hypothetical protein